MTLYTKFYKLINIIFMSINLIFLLLFEYTAGNVANEYYRIYTLIPMFKFLVNAGWILILANIVILILAIINYVRSQRNKSNTKAKSK